MQNAQLKHYLDYGQLLKLRAREQKSADIMYIVYKLRTDTIICNSKANCITYEIQHFSSA